ncbi:MAG: iron chaperone [Candidatus Eiseniibacteriota bacterium]
MSVVRRAKKSPGKPPKAKHAPDPNAGKREVDAYIAAAPRPARSMLRQLRRTIKINAPRAVEKLSYGMPYYHHHGRLTYIAAFTRHVSLFVMGKSKLRFAREMKPYQTSPSTLQFPFGTAIPAALVKQLIRARVRENEQE